MHIWYGLIHEVWSFSSDIATFKIQVYDVSHFIRYIVEFLCVVTCYSPMD
jgi:hypothetical protein